MSALNDMLFADVSPRWVWARVLAAWRAFADWWLTELLNILPEFLIAWLGGTAGPVIRLRVETNGVHVEGVSATGRVAQAGTIAWPDYSVPALDRCLAGIGLKRSDGTIGIVLPPATFFRRSFEVPVRARERVHVIARQELEHRTPFRADSVHLGMVVEPRQRGSETLTIRQTIVLRDHVEAAVRRLELPLDDIGFVASPMTDDDGSRCCISLRPGTDRDVPFTKHLIRFLIAVALVVTGLDAALFWWRQERAIAAIEAEIAAVRERALVVRGLEQEIARIGAALRVLEEKRASLSTAHLWRETSRVLPDHSWVTDWRSQDGLVSMGGFSASATELVGLFEKSPLFGQASLNAPIIFDAATGRERFSLVVHTRASPLPAQH